MAVSFYDDEEFEKWNSSTIESTNWVADKNELTVTFKNGSSYCYSNVSHLEYDRFRTAESKGKYFASVIKEKPFEKIVSE